MDFENVIEEASIQAKQPRSIKTKLYNFQSATLYHALNFEKTKEIRIQDENREILIETNMGVIANKVGSGKSLIALSLIDNDEIKNSEYICSFVSDNNLVKEYIKTNYCHKFKVNLLVVPHNLISQWSSYIENDTSYKYKVLSKKKELNEIFGELNIDDNKISVHGGSISKETYMKNIEEYFRDTKILLISSTYFLYFVNILYDIGIENDICFERIFYDEADSINLSNNKKLEANFYWFISSSSKNLRIPNAEFRYVKMKIDSDPKYIRYKLVKDGGIQRNGFIKNSFESIKNYERSGKIYLKCNEDFIDSNLKIPKTIEHIIKVKNPQILNILGKVLSNDVKKLIAEGDIVSAIQKLNCNYNPKDDILKIFTEKLTNQLDDKKSLLEMVGKKKDITEEMRRQKISKIESDIKELDEKINYIYERIKGKQICPISGDNILNEAYTPCCNKCFELENLISWLEIKESCPICREKLVANNIFVRDRDESSKKCNNKKTSKKVSTKYDEVMNILNKLDKNKAGRVLIFSENNNTFDKLEGLLKKEKINYNILSGNNNRINKILNFYREDTSDLRVILMNVKNYGCGINLENTSDIILMHSINDNLEKQVIGRAERNGRKGALNLWKIFYEDEIIKY